MLVGRQLALLREPTAAKKRADEAFALDEWDRRARRVAIAFDPGIHDRFEAEEAAQGTIRRGWRSRVWRRPFWKVLKANYVRLAEAAIAKDRWKHSWAREDLRKFYPKKWDALLCYEDYVIAVLQRFARWANDRRTRRLLAASRHLRTLNGALSA